MLPAMGSEARGAVLAVIAGALSGACDGQLPYVDRASLAPPPLPGQEMPAAPTPGPDTTVNAYAGTYFYFLAGDDKRTSDVTVHFPPMPLAYQKVLLNVALRCPPTGG